MRQANLYLSLIFVSCIMHLTGYSQKKTAKQKTLTDYSFGAQLKPIIPINYFGMGPIRIEDTLVSIDVTSRASYSMGMVMRRNFTDLLSFETGINYVRRNYSIATEEYVRDTSDFSSFGVVAYEIPLQLLVYIRLTKELYMNVSSGFSLNFFASDVQSSGINSLIQHVSLRSYWSFPSFLSNIGFEWRTKEKGGFYLGASLNSPFRDFLQMKINYYYQNNIYKPYSALLRGNYFTVDLRYFFPAGK
jgi:hypothetical protein